MCSPTAGCIRRRRCGFAPCWRRGTRTCSGFIGFLAAALRRRGWGSSSWLSRGCWIGSVSRSTYEAGSGVGVRARPADRFCRPGVSGAVAGRDLVPVADGVGADVPDRAASPDPVRTGRLPPRPSLARRRGSCSPSTVAGVRAAEACRQRLLVGPRDCVVAAGRGSGSRSRWSRSPVSDRSRTADRDPHAHPVGLSRGSARARVAWKNGRRIGVGPDPAACETDEPWVFGSRLTAASTRTEDQPVTTCNRPLRRAS